MAENKIHDRIEALKNALSNGLYEKDEALRLSLLTTIAGESIFFLGAPGCAKSMIARLVTKAFKGEGDVKYFETLLNQFSTPEDVFGNISLKALNGELEDEKGNKKEEYRRLTENMLPEADIAFLDEIWKASPAILNTLLTIINERKFHNGSKVQDVPLKALLAASNELPAKNRGLEALYDRFIVRLCIDFIKDEEKFFDMIEAPASSEDVLVKLKNLQISNAELKEWQAKIDKVFLSQEARSVISAIRKELTLQNKKMSKEEKEEGEAFLIGDRRWKKIARILKTSAFLNDRMEVDLMDCQLIEYCIWSTEKQQKKTREIVEKCIKENGLDCDTAIDEIRERIEEFEKIVTERFYKREEKCTPVTHKMKDGNLAYKILKPSQIRSYNYITPYYLCKTYKHGNYNRQGAYYDNSCNVIGHYDYYFKDHSFKIEKNIASWIDGYSGEEYSFEIEVSESSELVRNPQVFDTPDFLEMRQTKTDNEDYMKIKGAIDAELQKLYDFIQEKAAPYKANLFSDISYCDIIMTTVLEARKLLEDEQVKLDKQKARYH